MPPDRLAFFACCPWRTPTPEPERKTGSAGTADIEGFSQLPLACSLVPRVRAGERAPSLAQELGASGYLLQKLWVQELRVSQHLSQVPHQEIPHSVWPLCCRSDPTAFQSQPFHAAQPVDGALPGSRGPWGEVADVSGSMAFPKMLCFFSLWEAMV